MSEVNYDELAADVEFIAPTKAEPKTDVNAVAIRSDIAKVQEALTEFDKVSSGLADIAARYPVDLVYDVSSGKGMVEAIAHRAAWREPRLAVERLRKQAKAPVITLGKNIDARAAWLTEQLLIGEGPIEAQIKAEESRKEEAKRAREMAEFGRLDDIHEAIGEISMGAMVASTKTSKEIEAALVALRERVLEQPVFQEMMPQAEAARNAALVKLDIALKAKLHDESVAAALAAERAELAALREADAKRKAKEAAEAEAAAAQAAIAAQAERVRLDQEAAAARAKAQAEHEAKMEAERAEAARQRAEEVRLATEQRAAAAAKLAKEQAAKRKADAADKKLRDAAPKLLEACQAAIQYWNDYREDETEEISAALALCVSAVAAATS